MLYFESSSYLAISLVDGALFGSEIFPPTVLFEMSCVVFCMVSALFVIVGDVVVVIVVVTRKHDSNAFEPFYSFIIVYLYSKIMSRILYSHIHGALVRPNRCMKLLYFYLSISC